MGCFKGIAIILLTLLSGWNTDSPGDLNGSGAIDVDDLLGPCPGEGSCFEDHDTPGCKDQACCGAVCAMDDFCCEMTWDAICVAEAFDVCGTCGDADAGDCCAPHDSPGCDQWECCVEVCVEDPFCCMVTWDSMCAEIAKVTCGLCPPE